MTCTNTNGRIVRGQMLPVGHSCLCKPVVFATGGLEKRQFLN